MTVTTFEVNFDGLIGSTHNYAGLAFGNLASEKNRHQNSHPRAAALQGLRKMKQLMDLGLRQAIIPPLPRPDLFVLRELGFTGEPAKLLSQAAKERPDILARVSSASSAWTANAATVSPSADTLDGKVHITAANLANQPHRSMEAPLTYHILQALFPDPHSFVIHEPLPRGKHYGDEGAANHSRFCMEYGDAGVELFIYGREASEPVNREPHSFPARQTFEASLAVSHHHLLDPKRLLFARQSPAAIDAGVFHMDVSAVGNKNVFFFHEEAFCAEDNLPQKLSERFFNLTGDTLLLLPVSENSLTLETAVQTYLFNSQIISLPNGNMTLLLPEECRQNIQVQSVLQSILQGPNPIDTTSYVDLTESMHNGGGPACLRLRVVLNENEFEQIHSGVLLTEKLYATLTDWITRNYRESLNVSDLADRDLYQENKNGLIELMEILNLPGLYTF